MPSIKFIDPAGNEHLASAETGQSVMQAAVNNAVPGILADCGGGCACATCHAYVDEEWADLIPAPGPLESDMLACVSDRRSNSRLTCQIKVSSDMDGMVVLVADNAI
jgi:2Fe-2S ferredoxin